MSATTSPTVTDSPIVAEGTALSFVSVVTALRTFTQARIGAAVSDDVVVVNWGTGSVCEAG